MGDISGALWEQRYVRCAGWLGGMGLFLWLLGQAGSYWCSASSGSNMIPKWVANCRPKTGLGWADQFLPGQRWWLGHPVWGISCPANGHMADSFTKYLASGQNISRFNVQHHTDPPTFQSGWIIWVCCGHQITVNVASAQSSHAFAHWPRRLSSIQISLETWQSIWS